MTEEEDFMRNQMTVRFDGIHLAVFNASPIQEKKGTGTFDCVYDIKKYPSFESAYSANDYVEGNLIEQDGVFKIEAHHISNPEHKIYHTLLRQNIPTGIDVLDDNLAIELMQTLLIK